MNLIKVIIFLFIWQYGLAAIETDTTKFRDSSYYKIAVDYYKNKVNINPLNYYGYYQVACYYSLLENFDSAFYYLEQAIILNAKGENVLTDSDFNILRTKEKEWGRIKNLIKEQYLQNNPGITKPDLGFELYLIWVEDQRWRTLFKNYKLKEKPKPTREFMNSHYKRFKRIKKIIKKSGWPKYSEVGKIGGDAVFYIIQHDDSKYMKRYLPIFIEAGKQGEADLGKVAMMIDRVLVKDEGVQIYGSQSHREWMKGEDRSKIKGKLYPIADEENMRRRRKALGMADFDLNCKRLNVDYIEIKDRSDYKPIPIKKKWIKRGYLLIK